MPVITIPPYAPFLETLTHHIMIRYGKDPLALSRIKVFLPNQRSCEALRSTFLAQESYQGQDVRAPLKTRFQENDDGAGPDPKTAAYIEVREDLRIGKPRQDSLKVGFLEVPVPLPSFIALGAPEGKIEEKGSRVPGFNSLPPLMSPMKQRLILARLIHQWRGNKLALSSSQSSQLAEALVHLLEEMGREELSLTDLYKIVPETYASHWQKILGFLEIIIEHWPNIMVEEGEVDSVTYRNRLLSLYVQQWKVAAPGYPVIAAGITDFTPATVAFLKAVAIQPEGVVVLPGLDTQLCEEAVTHLAPHHPQHRLYHFLHTAGIKVPQVAVWAAAHRYVHADRFRLLNEMMCPAAMTGRWHQVTPVEKAALAHIEYMVMDTMQEEAAVIALILKETLGEEGKRAALVTLDRTVARQVKMILKQWDIAIDDSAGIPLNATPAAIFFRLVMQVVATRCSPLSLLACFKHPLAAGGIDPAQCRRFIRDIELHFLRGIRKEINLKDIILSCHHKGWEDIALWLQGIEKALAPLSQLMQQKEVSMGAMVQAHIACAEILAAGDDITGHERIWQGNTGAGDTLAEWLKEVLAVSTAVLPIRPQDYLALWDSLIEGYIYYPPIQEDRRLQILGPIEARLQSFDRVILAELNEGSWPSDVGKDIWMNRSMRQQLGLSMPEKRLGVAAHDFVQLCCAPEVVLIRAGKKEGKQTTASRWILRLQAMLRIMGYPGLEEGEAARRWRQQVKALYQPEEVVPCMPPAPMPPAEARPSTFAVTTVETLMRDPYSVYAAKILALKPLEPIEKRPGPLEFGILVHHIMEQFLKDIAHSTDFSAGTMLHQLRCCGEALFSRYAHWPVVQSYWWPRFLRIAAWIAEKESACRKAGRVVQGEQQGYMAIEVAGKEWRIKGKADRLEYSPEGDMALIDYKTGMVPGKEDIMQGIAPQLPLEALIAREGGYGRPVPVRDITYWKLSGGIEPAFEKSPLKPEQLAMALEQALDGIKRLCVAFSEAHTPYLSCPFPGRAPAYNAYAHLARVKEWQ